MSVSIENSGTLGRRLTISVPADVIASGVDAELKKTAAKAHLKGFRPGKAPMKLIKETYEPSARLDVMQQQVNSSLQAALKEHNLVPAGMPRIDFIKTAANEPFEYVAEFEVFPEITLKTLSGVDIEKVVADIRDEDVEETIQAIRKQHTFYEKVDRAAQEGDKVIIDFAGKLEGKPLENGSAQNQPLILGSKQFIPGFEEGLIGTVAGQEKPLTLAFPETYHVPALAGKTVEFDVTVKEVLAPQLPELNADFLKIFDVKDGNIETFRSEIRKNMEREVKAKTKMALKQAVFNKLAEVNTFDLPQALVDSEIEQLQKQTAEEMQRTYKVKSLPAMPKEIFTERARYRVKLGLLLEELHKHFQPKADKETINQLVEEIATTYADAEQAKQWLFGNPQRMKEIEALAIEDQLVNQLLTEAKVLEKRETYPQLMKNDHNHEHEHVHDENCNHDH